MRQEMYTCPNGGAEKNKHNTTDKPLSGSNSGEEESGKLTAVNHTLEKVK